MRNGVRQALAREAKAEKAREMLAQSGLKVTAATDLTDAAKKAVAAVR